jgi:hypothetical protein
MRRPSRLVIVPAVGALMAVAALPALAGHSGDAKSGSVRQIAELSGPRGVAVLGDGKTLVTEDNGNFDLVIEKPGGAKVVTLGNLVPGFANAIDNRGKLVYILVGGTGGAGGATLYKWRQGWDEAKPFADIGAYQATDPDPYDQENFPEDSNPFGVVVDPKGGVLVSDAAGNDLLKVHFDGSITTVARLKPRLVTVPDGLPSTDPDGNPLPPAGTPIRSEDVATSVTIGADGYYYVGELRGFPATPGTSQIWRINPHAKGALCNPKHPYRGMCKRYVDHLTSVVDLGADRWGNIYAVTLSKMSWLGVELGLPGSEVGAVYKIHKSHGASGHVFKRELARNKLILPGGVDVTWGGKVYEVGPVFGPGALNVIR